MKILVTGTAGFIGFHVANRLIKDGHEVVGTDSINAYYDARLKYDRLTYAGIASHEIQYNHPIQSGKHENYIFYQLRLEDKHRVEALFNKHQFDIVIHLAAQAGVRYSITNPDAYVDSNIVAFVNILECCRHHHISHLVFASSSSVYGLNDEVPFSVNQNTDHPISLYAASKKSNELMAHVYSHLFKMPCTGLRFFTVYGPWGRPDMALYIFTKAILEGKPIQVFNNGEMMRDFTYIDDIVEGIVSVMNLPPKENPDWQVGDGNISSSSAPYKIYNIGNNAPVKLTDFITAIEKETGKKAIINKMPMQPGDVPSTYADVSDLIEDTGFKPATSLAFGVKQFVEWYEGYYK